MAKIHVRGGSPLTLKFEDDDKNILAVRLEPKNSKGEYWVINEADDKKVKAVGTAGKNIFRETNPTLNTCEIGYENELRKAKTTV